MFQITRQHIVFLFQDLASMNILKSTESSWVYASVFDVYSSSDSCYTLLKNKNLRYSVSQMNVSTLDFRYRPSKSPVETLRDTIFQFSTRKWVELISAVSNLLLTTLESQPTHFELTELLKDFVLNDICHFITYFPQLQSSLV